MSASAQATALDRGDSVTQTPASAEVVALYRHLVTLRLLSARMVHLQRTEKVSAHASSLGEEGVIAASVLAARAEDWIFPGAREWGAAIVRGLSIGDYLHHAFGSGADVAKGHSAPDHPPARRVNVAPASGVAGAHVAQAVGAAWAAKIKKDDVACVALFGEAANSSGDLHNALNFAGVFKAPVVLVCRVDGRHHAGAPVDRAIAYGLAHARLDGSDPLAVLTTVRAALKRATSGQGATLLEVTTQPLAPSLDDRVWATLGDELLALGDRDPLVVLRSGLDLDAAGQAAIADEARAAIDAAVVAAEAAGPPARGTIFEDVYAEMPSHLKAQKESARG